MVPSQLTQPLYVLFSLCSPNICSYIEKNDGWSPQNDPNVVGSLYFVLSELTLCTIRVSLDQKRWQLHSDYFWYNLHLLNNLKPTFLQ